MVFSSGKVRLNYEININIIVWCMGKDVNSYIVFDGIIIIIMVII